MAGELTLEEKLEITSQALKDLHRQLYQAELHELANLDGFRDNPKAAVQHSVNTAALKSAIRRLEARYAELTAAQSSPSNPSS